MQREDLKNVLEVIGGVAISASLIFVGVETRNGALQTEQNTRAIEISAYQDLIGNMRLREGDMAFFHYERGAINEEQLKSVLRPLNLGNPKIQQFWNNAQQNFAGGYRDYVNQIIAEISAEQ